MTMLVGTEVRSEAIDASPLPLHHLRASRTLVSEIMLVAGGALAWVLVYVLFLSSFTAGHAQKQLYDQLREELAGGTAPMQAPIALGAPVALIDSPALGMRHLVVVEGTRPAQLADGPGHTLGSVLPGQVGTSVLMGRSVSFGAPFRHLATVTQGAHIDVTTGEGTFHYLVDDVRRPGDPVPAPLATGGSRLTLVSATGSALAPARTIYVDATLSGAAQPAGTIAAPDSAGLPFASDHSAGTLALLALALELLALAVAAVVWARHRWSTMAAWVAGLPIVVAALWLVSDIAARLLPNLI